MERIVKALIALARFIEIQAERITQHAIDRLEQDKIKAQEARDKAAQARTEAWDREVERHHQMLQSIQQEVAEADAKCDARCNKDEEKIKRLELA